MFGGRDEGGDDTAIRNICDGIRRRRAGIWRGRRDERGGTDDERRTPLFVRAIQERLAAAPPNSLTVLDIGTLDIQGSLTIPAESDLKILSLIHI